MNYRNIVHYTKTFKRSLISFLIQKALLWKYLCLVMYEYKYVHDPSDRDEYIPYFRYSLRNVFYRPSVNAV